MHRMNSLAEANHCGSHTELLFRFWSWAHALGRVPTPEEIASHFHVHAATAYRWRAAWCDAHGLQIPDPRPPGTRPFGFHPTSRKHKARRQPAPVQTHIKGQ